MKIHPDFTNFKINIALALPFVLCFFIYISAISSDNRPYKLSQRVDKLEAGLVESQGHIGDISGILVASNQGQVVSANDVNNMLKSNIQPSCFIGEKTR